MDLNVLMPLRKQVGKLGVDFYLCYSICEKNNCQEKNSRYNTTYRENVDETGKISGFSVVGGMSESGSTNMYGDLDGNYILSDEKYNDLIKWLEDWENVMNKNINSSNCVSVCMEYCDKHTCSSVDDALAIVKKYAKIPE